MFVDYAGAMIAIHNPENGEVQPAAVFVAVPDNLKSAVTHPSYYEPDLNPTYRSLGEHYGVAIIPGRLSEPRTKRKRRGRSGRTALDR